MSIAGSTFRTDEPMLHELLEKIHVQRPDCQCGWVKSGGASDCQDPDPDGKKGR